MIDFNKTTAALALGLVLTVGATPALAKKQVAPPGYAAQARAMGDLPLSVARAAAIHECNEKVAALKDYTWGVIETDVYRACMAQHGQPE